MPAHVLSREVLTILHSGDPGIEGKTSRDEVLIRTGITPDPEEINRVVDQVLRESEREPTQRWGR